MTITDSAPIIEYFARLDEGEAEKAASVFADDAVYIRQAMDATGTPSSELQVIRGRTQIRSYFEERGRRPYTHEIRSHASQGDLEFAEGCVDGGAAGPRIVFIATASLDRDGLISRYFATSTSVSEDDLVAVRNGR